MKSLTSVAVMACLLVSVIPLGCTRGTSVAPSPSVPSSGRVRAVTLTPYMNDPAFVVRFDLPRPDEWSEQRNLKTPPGTPDVTLRLLHLPSGGEIDVAVIPPLRPSDVAAQLSAKPGHGFAKVGPVENDAANERSAFSTKGTRDGQSVFGRTAVFRQKAMTDADVIVAAEWPAEADAVMRPLVDAVMRTLTSIAIGPQGDPTVALAMCLNEKGYRYYGASWCGFCHQQEQAFGPAAMSRLRSVDCSPPSVDGARIPECADAKITSYPTWVGPDGVARSGVRELEDLAKESGCPYAPKK